MNSEAEIINLIKSFALESGKAPTIQAFAEKYSVFASSIIRKFGSWNKLLKKAGLCPNKSDKRSDEQLIGWLKTHPDARYYEIPFGIRNRLEKTYNSISQARKIAGLRITDWRSSTKRRNYTKPTNAGRPIEFTEEKIVEALRGLAIRFGRPPRIRDITKKNCGFTPSAVLSRFGSLNAALQAASLPIIYSHQEQNKITKELEILMLNIKIATQDVPSLFNIEINKLKPTFVYHNRCEAIILKRSDIFSNIDLLLKHKKAFGEIVVWFLVDDSLKDDKQISTICIMDLVDDVRKINPLLADNIIKLRIQFDEISRKYVGHLLRRGNYE